MFTRTGLSALLSLIVGAVAAPTPAPAEFGPRFLVSGPNACDHQVAIDADGDAVFTWERYTADFEESQVEARRRSADGVFGPIQVVSGRSLSPMNPRLAIAAGGDAIIAWALTPDAGGVLGPEHAQFRALSAAGALGPIENLTNVLPAEAARVAMNARGKAIFAWRRYSQSTGRGAIEARSRSRAGVLGPIQRLPLAGTNTENPEVAINGRGETVFTWVRLFDEEDLIQARRRSATGELAEIHQNLGTGPFPRPQVVIDAEGNAIIAWNNPTGVVMRKLSATNALGRRRTVAQGSFPAFLNEIAMNAGGDAVFAFTQADATVPFTRRAYARVRSAEGVFGPVQRVSADAQRAVLVSTGIDARGRALFAWSVSDPFQGIGARRRSPIGTLSRPRTLVRNDPGVSQPRLAMNARGQAVMAWCETDIDNENITRVFGATFLP
jgi:hypothetical protein